jgi:hypothetical protein
MLNADRARDPNYSIRKEAKGQTITLADEARMTGWPTPRSSPNENRNTKSAPSHGETHGLTLAGVAHDLTGWPTPDASVAQDGEKPETWLARRERLKEAADNGNGCGTPLAMAVQPEICGWGTPRVTTNSGIPCPEHTGKGSRLEDQAAQLAGWCTPTTPSGGQINRDGTTITGRRPDGSKATVTLKDQAQQVSGTPGNSSDQTRKENSGGLGALNPNFVAWLMMGDLWPEIMACAPSTCSRKGSRKG